MLRLTALLLLVMAAACSRQAPALPAQDGPPQRIVSLDYCADQYVLKFVPHERIEAVSWEAAEAWSYMRESAAGLARVRPFAEDALLLKPDLIVRSYGGGAGATELFERAGVPVLQVPPVFGIEDVPVVTRRMAKALGAGEAGEAVAEEFSRRLEQVSQERRDLTALYMTPGGVTSGPGSLVDDMLVAAGYRNFEPVPGWRPIPLERLAADRPDRVAAAFFDTHGRRPNSWSASRHPLARKQLDGQDVTALPGAWMSCGGWFLIDAVEALARDAGND